MRLRVGKVTTLEIVFVLQGDRGLPGAPGPAGPPGPGVNGPKVSLLCVHAAHL